METLILLYTVSVYFNLIVACIWSLVIAIELLDRFEDSASVVIWLIITISLALMSFLSILVSYYYYEALSTLAGEPNGR